MLGERWRLMRRVFARMILNSAPSRNTDSTEGLRVVLPLNAEVTVARKVGQGSRRNHCRKLAEYGHAELLERAIGSNQRGNESERGNPGDDGDKQG